MSAQRRFAILVLIGIWVSAACLVEPFTGTTVVVDFMADLEPNVTVRLPDGSSSHYEMWIEFEGEGVISLGRFIVTAEDHIMSYPDVQTRIGSVTGADDFRRSGVRFVSEADLSEATGAFVSLEPNGETDIAPSGVIIMEGGLYEDGPGTLRGEMTGEYTTILGETKNPYATLAIIIAEDNAFF